MGRGGAEVTEGRAGAMIRIALVQSEGAQATAYLGWRERSRILWGRVLRRWSGCLEVGRSWANKRRREVTSGEHGESGYIAGTSTSPATTGPLWTGAGQKRKRRKPKAGRRRGLEGSESENVGSAESSGRVIALRPAEVVFCTMRLGCSTPMSTGRFVAPFGGNALCRVTSLGWL